jgi:hypothetical protein
VARGQIGAKLWNEPVSPYSPGQRIPFSGIYRARHDSHRDTHEMTMVQGAFFPACRVCGRQVQFIPLHTADRLREDYDFNYRVAAAAG